MTVSLPKITKEQTQDLNTGKGYRRFILREYPGWILFLNQNQSALGRAYAWLRSHKDMHQFDDISVEDLVELQCILGDYRAALGTVLGREPDIINCEWLGNEVEYHRGHGHMHFIPRYAMPVTFGGWFHEDEQFGKRATYKRREVDDEVDDSVLCSLRDSLKEALSR